MQVLIIIDAQNEFSAHGKRPVPDHATVIKAIHQQVEDARAKASPIAWVRHFNKPNESPAFMPGTWGAEFTDGFGPQTGFGEEVEFKKNVYGAFTGSSIGEWLKKLGADGVLISGFYTHGCVSSTSREAIMAGLKVTIDLATTGTCAMEHQLLGTQTAGEVRRSALLQLANMGATII